MKSLRLPWPFTGRDAELDLVRQSLTAGRRGIAVHGAAGSGKTRLALEAVHGTAHVLVTGTRAGRAMPFAAFAHVLPDTVSLHRAARQLQDVRVLLVDDAHLLDDASAALVHHVALHGRTRLLVLARECGGAPDAVARLWGDDLLPSLRLEALPREATARLLEAALGGEVEALTAHRLHRDCGGDLRLLREIVETVRAAGRRGPGQGRWAWRGPLPETARIRQLTEVTGRGTPRRVPAGPGLATALAAESADLEACADRGDVRQIPDGAGQRLVEEGACPDEPALPGLCAQRARIARLRGELREAADWSREGLRRRGDHPGCLAELAHAAACLGDLPTARAVLRGNPVPPGQARTWLLAAESDVVGARRAAAVGHGPYALHDAVRLGAPGLVAGRLALLPGGLAALLTAHAVALAAGDGGGLDEVARQLEERGLVLFAAEAAAQAARAHRDPRAARAARNSASLLARRCEGARTPALAGLTLGELTTRQRQIVGLAAAGLTNREIAEQLTLSVRTVGNHLYGAYARLGSSDRAELAALA